MSRISRVLAVAAVLVAVPAGSLSAQAPPWTHQATCDERAKLLRYVARQYSQLPVLRFLTFDGKVVEVLAAEDGNWTMVVTRPSGLTCAVGSGSGWIEMSEAVTDRAG